MSRARNTKPAGDPGRLEVPSWPQTNSQPSPQDHPSVRLSTATFCFLLLPPRFGGLWAPTMVRPLHWDVGRLRTERKLRVSEDGSVPERKGQERSQVQVWFRAAFACDGEEGPETCWLTRAPHPPENGGQCQCGCPWAWAPGGQGPRRRGTCPFLDVCMLNCVNGLSTQRRVKTSTSFLCQGTSRVSRSQSDSEVALSWVAVAVTHAAPSLEAGRGFV